MNKLLTPDEAARILNIKANTMRKWLRAGVIKGYRLGPLDWRVSEEILKDYLASCYTGKEETLKLSPVSDSDE